MNLIRALRQVLQNEDLNFLLTNRVPRIAITRFMGWYSRLRHPLLARASIGVWRLFTDLDLSEAKKSSFASLHECFTRELKPGSRPVDPDPGILVSPCDGIVGAFGTVREGLVFQAKGFPYRLEELLGPGHDASWFEGGTFVTLRLTSAMYHRFHAPHDAVAHRVTHRSGDTWNVNPIALARVERLFCRNERAVIRLRLQRGGWEIALVPVAAIMVASLRLHFLGERLHLKHPGPHEWHGHWPMRKGDELGWFEHGSTIIVFAPAGFRMHDSLASGSVVRMGSPLMHLP